MRLRDSNWQLERIAVALVNKYGNEEPKDLMDEILKYLNISIEEFRSPLINLTANFGKKTMIDSR